MNLGVNLGGRRARGSPSTCTSTCCPAGRGHQLHDVDRRDPGAARVAGRDLGRSPPPGRGAPEASASPARSDPVVTCGSRTPSRCDAEAPAAMSNPVRAAPTWLGQEDQMFDGRWRSAVDARTGPVGRGSQRHGITADVLTATGLVSATATAVAVAHGSPPPRHPAPDPDRPPRPLRRPGRQGRRAPARCGAPSSTRSPTGWPTPC